MGENASRAPTGSQSQTLTLHASVDGEKASSVTVGFSADVNEVQTYRAPPGHFSDATLHAIGDDGEGPFARQVVPRAGGHTFRLRLKGTAGKTVTLTAEGVSTWEGGAVILTDERSRTTYDLHEHEAIRLSLPEGEEVPLRLQLSQPSPRRK